MKGEKQEGRTQREARAWEEGCGDKCGKVGRKLPLRVSYDFEKVNPSIPQIWRNERSKIRNSIKKGSGQVVGKEADRI